MTTRLVTIGDSLVKLSEVRVGGVVQAEGAAALSYLGGDADNKVEVPEFELQKLDLDGGAGVNEFKLTVVRTVW